MNVEWGDFDDDGLFDVFVTNITDEYMREGNFLWRNQGAHPGGPDGAAGAPTFADVAAETGTRDTGWGWAGKFFDYDNDGWLDLYVANGWVSAGPENYVVDIFELIIATADVATWPTPATGRPWATRPSPATSATTCSTTRAVPCSCDDAARHGVDSIRDARGVAVADFDDDGRLDLFVTNAGAEPHLFRNVGPAGNRWVELALEGAGGNPKPRSVPGSGRTAGGRQRARFVDGGNGFAAQSTRRVHFGLGGCRLRRAARDRLAVGPAPGVRGAGGRYRIYRVDEGEAALVPAQENAARRVRPDLDPPLGGGSS
jgi:enediyne biosynthesis protein E4